MSVFLLGGTNHPIRVFMGHIPPPLGSSAVELAIDSKVSEEEVAANESWSNNAGRSRTRRPADRGVIE